MEIASTTTLTGNKGPKGPQQSGNKHPYNWVNFLQPRENKVNRISKAAQ